MLSSPLLNELVASIHDRLALILKPEDYDRWLTTDDGEEPALPSISSTPSTPTR
jgi:putative SOS response-associated peptidase YedK